MTKSNFAVFSLTTALLVTGTHLILVLKGVFDLTPEYTLTADLALFTAACLGTLIMLPAVGHPDKTQFVNRFLVLTTVQMLFIMSLFVYMLFKLKSGRELVFHTLGIALILIVFQSIILNRALRKKS